MAVDKKEQTRLLAEASLEAFIRLVHPNRVLGHIHLELINFWTRGDAKSHQLVLLPRDHGKSAMVAYWVAWEIVKNPHIRILYISSTANLATKQLKFIKDILASSQVRFYWPELVHPDEAKREKWTESEISVDHPKRKAENVRDPTVFTAGLTTNIAGMHCDVTVMDDVVVIDNAYTDEARSKVEQQYSLLSSIEGTSARQRIVGTRYHPRDLYNALREMKVTQYDDNGDELEGEPLYEVFERQVEDRGDGTGQFLWPKQQRSDGVWFGFDRDILAKKRSQYTDKVQFRAQYYNDPNDTDSVGIKDFQYYDKGFLTRAFDQWSFKGNRLNVFAAIDFAYSLGEKADYTSIVVVGCDGFHNYYVLDIARFKANNISDYYKEIFALYKKWEFRKLRAEVTAAQAVIVKDLKDNYIRRYGLALAVEDSRPTRAQGTKQERINAVLQPRYAEKQIWHYLGGHCETLENELVLSNPAHDDVKDALASCIDFCEFPARGHRLSSVAQQKLYTTSRFGGMA